MVCASARTQENLKDLPDTVIVCETAEELISLSSTIILMVSNAEAISDILQLDQQQDLHGKTLSFFLLGELEVTVPEECIPKGSPYL